MVILTEPVLADLKDKRIQFRFDPADSTVLLRVIGSLILIIRVREDRLRFLEIDTAVGIFSQCLAFRFAETESHPHTGIADIPLWAGSQR